MKTEPDGQRRQSTLRRNLHWHVVKMRVHVLIFIPGQKLQCLRSTMVGPTP